MHLRPDRLRAHAAEAADMADALARLGRAPGPAGGLVDTAVARARRELAEVEMSLRSATAAAEAADHAAENALWRARRPVVTAADPARQWCVEAVGLLHDTALRAARLASAVAMDWLDADGQAWAVRIDALRRDLDEAAREADDLVRRLPESDPALASALAAALRAAPPGSYGPRLGDTSGARVDDAHGMRVAQLPEPPA